ncbi:hypothetical protein LCGC14_1353990 [marine sediment metagenome]|uniref:Uncharacterized protein n=1 Tax=marine sediment metagenome TaxID=412755 RepID=A0A0F9MQM0_9ZZZZ
MRVEVKLERLIMDAFPIIMEEEYSLGLDEVPVEAWSGRLADLVTAILKMTAPDYRTYQDG